MQVRLLGARKDLIEVYDLVQGGARGYPGGQLQDMELS